MWQCGNYKMFKNKVFFILISDFFYIYILILFSIFNLNSILIYQKINQKV